MLDHLTINQLNYQSIINLIDGLFTRYSKVMVVRVDLSYRKDIIGEISPDFIKFQI